MNPLQTTTTITLDAWLDRVATWKTATRELVRLWLLNDLGCQRELANHLGLTPRAIAYHAGKLRESGDLPEVDESDGRSRVRKHENVSYSSPVPKSSYPSAITPETEALEEEVEGLNLPTAAELSARVLNLQSENASLRAQLQAQPAVQATKVELTEALAKIKELEAKVDSLSEENEVLCDELAEMEETDQDEEIERLREELRKAQKPLADLTPMERRWREMEGKVFAARNPLPEPEPSTRTWADIEPILKSFDKEGVLLPNGLISRPSTFPVERWNKGCLLVTCWNLQKKPDGQKVPMNRQEVKDFLVLLDAWQPPEAVMAATTPEQTVDV